MLFRSEPLTRLTAAIMRRAGAGEAEAATVARRLVASNLAGHDSHGVIRIPLYVKMAKDGVQRWGVRPAVVLESDVLVVLDGNRGYGQVIGEEAMAMAIERAGRKGIALLGLRNVGHLGRMGDWAEMAVEAGMVSLHFLNTRGGLTVAPYGGSDPRLSTNPITVGIPGEIPVILDMTTSSVAQGKIVVARNRGEQVPEGWLIDRDGRPSRDPGALFEGGALLPIAGHKGSGLSIVTDLLAGALIGSESSGPDAPYVVNNMMAIVIDPRVYADGDRVRAEVDRFVAWVRASPPAPGGEVLMPGEVEARTRQQRLEHGIPVDDETLRQIRATATGLGMTDSEIDALLE
jgi:hydroxycarboxylate dehydrogenase B